MAANKIEQYLIELELSYREIDTGMWLIEDVERGMEGVVVMYAPPLVIVRVGVMKTPKDKRLELYQKLLELNAKDITHGAYALEDDEIVMVDTLAYETMDLGDLQASLEGIGLALIQHYPILSAYNKH